ncbi:MAG: hypothetical protein KatS3mg095_0647 [Candidatus Parcubacteria bacterium]|nr:MAG: hypothetical protein KatS3mg095_0647 [Candidatus Parcubacteria bacterium]
MEKKLSREEKTETLLRTFPEYQDQIKEFFYILRRILMIPAVYRYYQDNDIKNSLGEIIEKLESKYQAEHCREYLTFFMLKENVIEGKGLSPKKDQIREFDFEGEDSIINQLKSFLREWEEKNKEIINSEKERTFISYLELLKLTEDDLKNKSVLDIGAGENYFIEYLYDKNLTIYSYGLDIKPPINPKHFVLGRLEKIPFQDETFDLVTCVNVYPGFFVLEKFEEGNESLIRQLVRQGLNEMLRVTKKGGEIRITPISEIVDSEEIKKYEKLNDLKKWEKIIKEEIEDYCKELQLGLEIQFLKEGKYPIFINQDDKPVKTKDYYFQKDYLIIIKK